MIPIKGIVHEVLTDAPFIGAIVIADGCMKGCPECINEYLKDEESVDYPPQEIIDIVKEHPLNEGIIFSGLEWSEQPQDLILLVNLALQAKLKVLIYTYHEEEEFFRILPTFRHEPIYIKFGLYDKTQLSDEYYSKGVRLPSLNQYISFFGEN